MQDVDPAWTAFYRNTLRALASGGEPGGTNAGMAPVHDRAAALAVGPHVVELGCCFGFLSLRLAAEGHEVTAVDLVPGTAHLLGSVSAALGTPVTTLAGNALAVPLQDASADTVFAVHLLEHLPRGLDATVLAEMLRVARRRAVVAVPFEDEPTPAWGHVRTFDRDDLHALGAATGLPFTVDGAPRRLAGDRHPPVIYRSRARPPSSATSTAPPAESAAAPSTVASKPLSNAAGAAVGVASSAASVTPSAEPR